jgi:predicted lipoprotein with Yx(FWY)xxD motif
MGPETHTTQEARFMIPLTSMRPPTARWLPLAVVATLLLILAACSAGATATPSEAGESASASESEAAGPSETEAAGESYEITVADTDAGSALAGEDGVTLYTFDNDTTPGTSACTGDCATNWPPFTVDEGEQATAGEGVTGEIGTITRDDGSTQVTYNDKPLYYFSGDSAAGDSNGDGVGGIWHIAAP